MKLIRILPLSALALAVLGACSSLPSSNAELDAAHSDYRAAQNDELVRQLAPAEMRRATEALTRADNAFERRDKSTEVDHLAYLARSQIAVAQETAHQKSAEQSVAGAAAARDQARLAARTNEADAAVLSAQSAQRSAEASQQQAEASQQQTEAALRQANAARAQASRSDDDARRLQAELAALNATKSERGLVVTIGDVLFDTNQAQLKQGGLRSVEKLVVFLKQYPQRSAMIEGFTDSTGGSALNQALSAQRAEAVRAALVQMGVSADRLGVHAYGEAYPVAGNDSAEGRQSNRRVEIILSEDQQTVSPR